MFRSLVKSACVGLCVLVTAPLFAQQAGVAVIDVQRVVTQSDRGKEVLQKLQKLQQQKITEGKAIQQKLDALKQQFSKQRFTLSQDKLDALRQQIENQTIKLKRFQDDAQRELDDARKAALDKLQQQIMPIINQVGKEKHLKLIFNKYQSGLVYAADSVDITDEIIRRFNTKK
jgi:outer membrane protein